MCYARANLEGIDRLVKLISKIRYPPDNGNDNSDQEHLPLAIPDPINGTTYILVQDGARYAVRNMAQGLKSDFSVNPIHHARSEGLLNTRSFREPLQRGRGLLLCDGYNEAGNHVSRKDGNTMCLAVLWRPANSCSTDHSSFAIVTISPNEVLEKIHDRMPVILPDVPSMAAWLGIENLDYCLALSTLKTYEADELHIRRIGSNKREPAANCLSLFD